MANSGEPVFGGVASGYLESGKVHLEWFQGADRETATEELVYRAYAGTNEGPVDLTTPVGTSLPGATKMVLPEMAVADYRFVVRVLDEDGNEDDNTAAVRVSLLDDRAPEFDGILGASVQGPRSLLVQWKAAVDDQTPSHQLRYRIYVSEDPATVYENLVAESVPGALRTEIAMDSTESILWVGVRAVDAAGNESENSKISGSQVPETERPVFQGVSSALPLVDSVKLNWSPGVDNVTASSDMRYAIYAARESGGQDLSRPTVITLPGVTGWTVSDLLAGETYYFIVRALDAAGNTDENTLQLSAETAAADLDAPIFSGISALTSTTSRTLSVSWDAASDAGTPSRQMVYELFIAETSGAQTFSSPAFITPSGAQQAELINLSPDTEYFVVVRARDKAGNTDANVVELSLKTGPTTADTAPPQLVGSVRAAQVPSDPTLLLVSWTGASDNAAKPEELRGHVCVGLSSADCEGSAFFTNYNGVGTMGSASYFARGLTPRSDYFVSVRLEDVSGNLAPTGGSAAGRTATSFTTNVKPIIDTRCNQCHAYTYGTLVNITEQDYVDPDFGELFLVDTNSAVQSYFIRKLRESGDTLAPFGLDAPANYGGDRMPSDGSDFLTADSEQILIDWIDQGAFSN